MFVNKEKWYDKSNFIKMVNVYLRKFNFNIDFPNYNLLNEIEEIEGEIIENNKSEKEKQDGGKIKYKIYKRYIYNIN
jgi:hypothetical protein